MFTYGPCRACLLADTPGCSIIILGDTSPTEALIESCHGCDVLIH